MTGIITAIATIYNFTNVINSRSYIIIIVLIIKNINKGVSKKIKWNT